MATAVSALKLVVDDKQYLASIKEAKKGMQDLQRSLESAGKSFEDCDSAVAEYARGLGKMETESRTAKGQINELSSAFIELSRVYNQMTEQERQSPVGQALSKSLDELKTRTVDAKTEMANLNKQLEPVKQNAGETGGVMGELAKKFTLNLDVMKLFNVGLQAAQGALNIVKDAFFENEAMVDEWGRTVDTAKSLYQGFLNALNNGDISGFLSNINEIMVAAVNAYNALDRLQTMQRIQAPQISAQMTENDRFRKMLQTGRYVAPLDGRAPTPGLKEGDILSPQQMKRVEEQLKNGTNTVVNLVGNEVKQAGIAIDNVYTRWGLELGMSEQEFRRGTSSMAEFDKRMAGYDLYTKWKAEANAAYAKSGGMGYIDSDKSNPYIKYKNWGKFRVDGDRYGELVDLIAQRDQKMGMAYGLIGQSYRTVNRTEGITVAQIMGRSGGSKGKHRTSRKTTPSERAADMVATAERTYAETLQKSAIRMEVGLDSSLKGKKDELSAQQRLFDAYNDAYAVYADPKYKEAAENAAKQIKLTAAEVKKLEDADAEAKEAAREQARAQKKLAAEQEKRAKLEASWQTASLDAMKTFREDLVKRQSTTSVGGAEFNKFQENIVDITTLRSLISAKLKNGLTIDEDVSKSLMKQILNGENIDDTTWKSLIDKLNEKLKELKLEPVKIDLKTGDIESTAKKTKSSWEDVAKAVSEVGNAFQQIEDPVAKVAGLVAQAVATIALTFAQSLKGTVTPWDWIAAAAAGTATMLSTISAIKSATAGSYAEGGIVPGNSFSGDNMTANVNSGELILNRAQQDSVARQLTSGFAGNMQLTAVVTGEQIRMALNNNSRRMGRGEYVTAK